MPRGIDDESALDRMLARGREGTREIEERDLKRREAHERKLDALVNASRAK